jgi:hypothetical protein
MLPLPDELDEFLDNLADCNEMIYTRYLDPGDPEKVAKLRELGLVEQAIVLTDMGRKRVAALRKEREA